jgi:hypothetical protein
MPSLAKVIIETAIDEVNEEVEGSYFINKAASTSLLGPDSSVDSLSLVRLLVTVERLIEEMTGESIVIVDESAFEAEHSPFATVLSLTLHVDKLIAK